MNRMELGGIEPQAEKTAEDFEDTSTRQTNLLEPEEMDSSQMTFESFQSEQLCKKLERSLKLEFLKKLADIRAGNPSSAWSASSISSICGDNSDYSYVAPSLNSSRVGSEVVSSSMNLRNILLRKTGRANRLQSISPTKGNNSPVNENSASDLAAMPPPSTTKIRVSLSKSKMHIRNMSMPDNTHVQSSRFVPKTPILNEYSTQVYVKSPLVSSTYSKPYTEDDVSEKTESSTGILEDPMQRSRVFSKWRVILNDQGQLLIKGTLENGAVVRSKPVVKRISSSAVKSNMNYTYHLQGNIVDQRYELPDYVRGKFYNGFPDDWKNVHQLWQSYVVQGCSPNFRWPMPVADSDDDLKSDITEITALPDRCNTKNNLKIGTLSKPKAISLDQSTSHNDPNDNANASDHDKNYICSRKNSEKNRLPSNASLDCTYEVSANNSSSTNQSKLFENSNDKGNEKQRRSAISSMRMSDSKVRTNKLKSLIPENNLEIIVKKLAEKDCSPEYIDKLVDAIVSLDYVIGEDSLKGTEAKILADGRQYDDPGKPVRTERKRRRPYVKYTTDSESETDGAYKSRLRKRKLVSRKSATASLKCTRSSRYKLDRSDPMLNFEQLQPSKVQYPQSQNSRSREKSDSCKPKILQSLVITRGKADTGNLHATGSLTIGQRQNVAAELSDSCDSLTEDEKNILHRPDHIEQKDSRITQRKRANTKCSEKHSRSCSSFAYPSSSDYSDDGSVEIQVQSPLLSSKRMPQASAEVTEALDSGDFNTSTGPHKDTHLSKITASQRETRSSHKTIISKSGTKMYATRDGDKLFKSHTNINAQTSTHHKSSKLQDKTRSEKDRAVSFRSISDPERISCLRKDGERLFKSYEGVDVSDIQYHKNTSSDETENERRAAIPQVETYVPGIMNADKRSALQLSSNVDTPSVRYQRNAKIQAGTRHDLPLKVSHGSDESYAKIESSSNKSRGRNDRINSLLGSMTNNKNEDTASELTHATRRKGLVSEYESSDEKTRSKDNIHGVNATIDHGRVLLQPKVSLGSDSFVTEAKDTNSRSNTKKRSSKSNGREKGIDSLFGSVEQNKNEDTASKLTNATRRKGLRSESEKSNEMTRSEDKIHDGRSRTEIDRDEAQPKVSDGSNLFSTKATFIDSHSKCENLSKTLRSRKVSIVSPESFSPKNDLRSESGTSNQKQRSEDERLGSESNPKLLTSWTPIVICKSNSEQHLVFRGKLLNMMGHVAGRRHQTDFIEKRISSRIVKTINNEFYELAGNLNNTKQVVPKELIQNCRNGCPSRIHHFCKLWAALKQPGGNCTEIRETECDITVDKLSVSMSSRGRRILPPLNYWEGESVKFKDDELVYTTGVSLSSQGSSLNTSKPSPAPLITSSGKSAVKSRTKNPIEKLKKGSKEIENNYSPGKKSCSRIRKNILNELKENCIEDRKLIPRRIEYSSSDDERSSSVLRCSKKKLQKLDITRDTDKRKPRYTDFDESQAPNDGKQGSVLRKREQKNKASPPARQFYKSPLDRVKLRQASSADKRDSSIRHTYYKNVHKETDLLSEDSEMSRILV